MKFSGTNINAITYGNGKFVAVGGATFPPSSKGAYSSDGVTWVAISDNAITYGNGKFVAVGGSGKGAYSSDGVTWVAISDTKINGVPINAITYSNGIFVAVGSFGRGVYSTDGVTWLAIDDMTTLSSISAITYGQDKLMIGISNGTVSYSLNLVS